jgi:hypothetical protein
MGEFNKIFKINHHSKRVLIYNINKTINPSTIHSYNFINNKKIMTLISKMSKTKDSFIRLKLIVKIIYRINCPAICHIIVINLSPNNTNRISPTLTTRIIKAHDNSIFKNNLNRMTLTQLKIIHIKSLNMLTNNLLI